MCVCVASLRPRQCRSLIGTVTVTAVPRPGRPGNRHAPAQQARALGHAQQADRFYARQLGLRDAAPVVADRQCQRSSALPHHDANRPRVRMPHDIGERFLQNSEHRQLARADPPVRLSAPTTPGIECPSAPRTSSPPTGSPPAARDDPAPPAAGRSRFGGPTEC